MVKCHHFLLGPFSNSCMKLILKNMTEAEEKEKNDQTRVFLFDIVGHCEIVRMRIVGVEINRKIGRLLPTHTCLIIHKHSYISPSCTNCL